MRAYVLAGLGIFCLATAAGGIYWLGSRTLYLWGTLVLLAFSAVCRQEKFWQKGALLVVCCLLGFLNGQRMVDPTGRLVVKEKQPAVLTGLVVPGSWQNSEENVRFTLETENGPTGLVRIFWRGGTTADERRLVGARVSVQGSLQPPRYFHNPGMLDWSWIRRRQKEAGTMSVSAAPKLLMGGSPPVWRQWLWDRRQGFRTKLASAMPTSDAALLENMLFGGYNGLDPEMVRDFTRTGLVHILSVSGSHVALVAAAGGWICRQAGLAVRFSAILLSLLIWGYVFFSGLVVPAVRSALMGSFVLIGNVLERPPDSIVGLTLLASLFLAGTPSLAVDMSFLLSFGSTAGLLLLAPRIAERLSAWPSFLALPLAVALGSQLAVTPLILAFSHQLPLSSLAANLFFTPLAELAMTVALAGLLLPVAGQGLLVVASLLLGGVERGLAWLSWHPFAALPVRQAPWWSAAFYYLALISYFYVPRSEKQKLYPRRPLMLLAFGVWLLCLSPLWLPRFAVYFLDVGQGNAAVVLTPHGHAIVIDSGSREAGDTGRRVVSPVVSGLGVYQIELLLLTHGHDDHAGGAVAVAADHPVRIAWFPADDFSPAIEQLLTKQPPHALCRVRGGERTIIDGVLVETLYVGRGTGDDNENEHSAFYLITYGGKRFLFTGDAPADQELMAMNSLMPVDVLQVAHHGSKTSSDAAFLAACRPKNSVISVGENNRFGHPAPDTLLRLARQGSLVFRTDRQGAIAFEQRRGHWMVKTFR